MTHRHSPLAGNPLITAADLEQLHTQAFSWALTCVGGRYADAQDVLQVTYVAVIEGRARFDGQSNLRTWLFAVIRTQAHSLWRRTRMQARRLALAAPLDEQPGSESSAALEHDAARVLAAWSVLPPRQREVLDLVFYRDLSIAEAAVVLGISVGSARTHYERGKEALRRALDATSSSQVRTP